MGSATTARTRPALAGSPGPAVRSRPGQGGGCRYDVTVWRGLTDATPPCASPWPRASPERERLGFDAIASFRNDYLMTVLGGSRSTWSAIKMAEVYSRIVTGRMVRARFTPVAGSPPEAELPMRNPRGRETVLDGLRRVVKTGTAAWLGREFAGMGYGPEVALLGKTGTMKVAGEAPTEPGVALLRQLAHGDCGLRWDAKAGVLKFGLVAPRNQAEAARQIMALKEIRCRVRVAGRRELAQQAAAQMQRYACGYRNCQPGDFQPEPDGRVLDLPLRAVEPPLLDGHAIAVVAVRQAGGQPVRGLTIVVNLQDKRQADTPALAVAAAILRFASRPCLDHRRRRMRAIALPSLAARRAVADSDRPRRPDGPSLSRATRRNGDSALAHRERRGRQPRRPRLAAFLRLLRPCRRSRIDARHPGAQRGGRRRLASRWLGHADPRRHGADRNPVAARGGPDHRGGLPGELWRDPMTFLHDRRAAAPEVRRVPQAATLAVAGARRRPPTFAIEGESLQAVRFFPAGAVREAGGRLTAIPEAADAYATALDAFEALGRRLQAAAPRAVLAVRGVTRTASGCFWLQAAPGVTLEAWLAEHPGRVAEPVVAAFARCLAEALENLARDRRRPRGPLAAGRADRRRSGAFDRLHGRSSPVLPDAAKSKGPC
ncbi:hypothetical protein ACRAWD_27405 [Caulobacter segnis]